MVNYDQVEAVYLDRQNKKDYVETVVSYVQSFAKEFKNGKIIGPISQIHISRLIQDVSLN